MINLDYLYILWERPKMRGIDMVNAGLLDMGRITCRTDADKLEFLTQCKALLELDPKSNMVKCDVALGLGKNQLSGFLKWLRQGRLGGGHDELLAFFAARTAAAPVAIARAKKQQVEAVLA